jgi:hypothetical protein
VGVPAGSPPGPTSARCELFFYGAGESLGPAESDLDFGQQVILELQCRVRSRGDRGGLSSISQNPSASPHARRERPLPTPSRHSFPARSRRPIRCLGFCCESQAAASYKFDAVTSTVCETPSMSLIVTRQDREGMEAKYHIVFSSPQSRTGPTEPGCDSIWPQSKEKSLDLLPRRDAAFAEPMEAHSICRLRDDQASFNDGSMRRSIVNSSRLEPPPDPGHSWVTIRGGRSAAKRRQNKGLCSSAVWLTAECSTIELPGN